MATLVNLTINGYDIVGSNFDPNRASAYLTPNTPNGLIVVDGASLRLGGKRVKFDSTGQIIFGGLVATNSADNPTSFAYRVTIVYTPIGARKPLEWTSSDFTLTTSLNLANISEAFDGLAIAPTWQSQFRDEMEAIAGLTGEDAAIANRVNTPGSATDIAVRAKIEAALAPGAVVNKRHPLTAAYHVESYGAVGDWNGTTGTDNLPALNAIVAAILARPDKTGRIIFGPGDFWLSNDWMIDGEDVEVICHPNTTIRTTSITTRGGAVSFIGGGVQTPSNFVLTPQRRRFKWKGGRVSATGSGTMDNAIGVARVASCYVGDVRLDADRKAVTPQINVDNVTIERVVVERADYDAICIETGCLNVTVRDVDVIATLGSGVRFFSDSATDPDRKNRNVLLQRVNVRSAGAFAVSLSDTEKVTLSQVSGSVLQINGRVSDLRIEADCSFATINYPGDLTTLPVTTAKPLPATVTYSNSWVAFGSPYPTPSVRKTSDGFTVVEVAIKSGTMTAGTVVATIPRGYRPEGRVVLTAIAGGAPAYVYAEASGSVVIGTTIASNAVLAITGTFPST